MVKEMKSGPLGPGVVLVDSDELGSDASSSILDMDYDEIEHGLFGARAIDCLKLASESSVAPPQGSPFLQFAQPLSAILRRYKGIYSI